MISGNGTTTYLFVHGLTVNRPLNLRRDGDVVLSPARCSPDRAWLANWAKDEVDEAAILLFLPRVTSQIQVRVPKEDGRTLAMLAWNTQWDAVLLAALFHCEVGINLQSNVSAEHVSSESVIGVTNHHFRGLSRVGLKTISNEEAAWIEANFEQARDLLETQSFMDAVHALWSYRWHTFARARLALLWSGIEGIFGIDSELSFRISLYAARFLAPDDPQERSRVFDSTKRLYKQRSAAVHGNTIKGNANASVEESAILLQRLLRHCVEIGAMPDIEVLAP